MTAATVTRNAAELSREAVLSKAVCRAARHMGVTHGELAEIIGLSEPSISRMMNGKYQLKEASKSFELGQYFVRLFRGLDAIAAGDDTTTRSWLRSENKVLRGRPLQMMKKIGGLTAVAAYVDAQRAII